MLMGIPPLVGSAMYAAKPGVYPNHTYDTENLNITSLRSDEALRPVHMVNDRRQDYSRRAPGARHPSPPKVRRSKGRPFNILVSSDPGQTEILVKVRETPETFAIPYSLEWRFPKLSPPFVQTQDG